MLVHIFTRIGGAFQSYL